MPASPVSLYVVGERQRVVMMLDQLKTVLPDNSSLWVDDNPSEGAGRSLYSGWVSVDVGSTTRRVDAIAEVNRAVTAVDTGEPVVVGGDLFNPPH